MSNNGAYKQGKIMAGIKNLWYQTTGNDAANIRHVADDVINNGHLFVADCTDVSTVKQSEIRLLTYGERGAHAGKFLNCVVYSHIVTNCRFRRHHRESDIVVNSFNIGYRFGR